MMMHEGEVGWGGDDDDELEVSPKKTKTLRMWRIIRRNKLNGYVLALVKRAAPLLQNQRFSAARPAPAPEEESSMIQGRIIILLY